MINLTNVFKKPLITAGIISAAIASGTANAEFFSDAKVYVGGGVDYNNFNIGKAKSTDTIEITKKNKGMGFSPVIGVKFNQNFGIEAGYGFNKKVTGSKDDNAGKWELSRKANNAYLDFMGYMPVMDKLELIAGLGIGKLMTGDLKVSYHDKAANTTEEGKVELKNGINLRAKLGAKYNVNDNIGIRLLAAYQKVNNELKDVKISGKKVGWITDLKSIGLSAVYTF
jgi:outer membrane protein W